jgi:hypothetical protein
MEYWNGGIMEYLKNWNNGILEEWNAGKKLEYGMVA